MLLSDGSERKLDVTVWQARSLLAQNGQKRNWRPSLLSARVANRSWGSLEVLIFLIQENRAGLLLFGVRKVS